MRAVLGIDTASSVGSIGLVLDGAPAGVDVLPEGRHSSGLSAAARRLLGGSGLEPGSLSGVAICEGPGSFTGLRVGLAWGKGLTLGRGIPMALVSAHEACAHALRGRGATLVTLLPGERGFVQLARWRGGERVVPDRGPDSVAEGDLAGALSDLARNSGPGALAVGARDLAPALRDALGRELAGTRFGAATAVPGIDLLEAPPLGGAVAELGDLALREGRAADWIAAAPVYGRAPNARRPMP